MGDNTFWTAVAAIAQTAAAIATFAAVALAMWHWSRQWIPRARVSLDKTFTTNPHGQPQQWISLTVVNTGISPTRLTGIEYRPHRWSKERWFHIYDHTIPYSSKMPVKLEQTESAQYFWTVEDWEKAISTALRESLQKASRRKFLWKRGLRVQVRSSTGDVFSAKVPPTLTRRLAELTEA